MNPKVDGVSHYISKTFIRMVSDCEVEKIFLEVGATSKAEALAMLKEAANLEVNGIPKKEKK